MAKLFLIRGLPGSSKSTKARQIIYDAWREGDYNYIHLEADMFFLDYNGVYKFDPLKIRNAHEWCFNSARIFLNQGYNVVVSNTFTQKWEYQKYIDYTKENSIPCEVIVCKGKFQNIHGVPEEVIRKMEERWED